MSKRKRKAIPAPKSNTGVRTSLGYSLLLHGALFILLCGGIKGCGHGGLGNSDNKGESGGTKKGNNEQIIDKKTIEVELVETTQEESPGKKAKPKTKYVDRDCDGPNWFGGIGIQMIPANSDLTVVDHVYKGYPAEKAGIEAGDILLNSDEYRGEPGTTVKVLYKKRGQNMVTAVDVVREKICIEGNSP